MFNNWDELFEHFDIPKGDWFPPQNNPPRILVLCQGGNTRSAAVSFILKYKYEIESLTASLERNTPDTIKMLIRWCDFFIVVDDKLLDKLPDGIVMNKVLVCNIGDDVWFHPFHPELLQKCLEEVQRVLKYSTYLDNIRSASANQNN